MGEEEDQIRHENKTSKNDTKVEKVSNHPVRRNVTSPQQEYLPPSNDPNPKHISPSSQAVSETPL